mmetsp:Transcript_52560/g.151530  ORF Transcript_52560/g.151530 Transcript_52560/m.151530 type:complete len:208 (-) Transcript_52560:539-1162(-)
MASAPPSGGAPVLLEKLSKDVVAQARSGLCRRAHNRSRRCGLEGPARPATWAVAGADEGSGAAEVEGSWAAGGAPAADVGRGSAAGAGAGAGLGAGDRTAVAGSGVGRGAQGQSKGRGVAARAAADAAEGGGDAAGREGPHRSMRRGPSERALRRAGANGRAGGRRGRRFALPLREPPGGGHYWLCDALVGALRLRLRVLRARPRVH